MSSLFPALRTGFIKALLPGRGGGGLLTSSLQRRVVRGLRKCSHLKGWTRVSRVQYEDHLHQTDPNALTKSQTLRDLYFGWLLCTVCSVKPPRSDTACLRHPKIVPCCVLCLALTSASCHLAGPGQNLLSNQAGSLCSCTSWCTPTS